MRALKKIREERGYTLQALATLSGLGKSTINNYEKGTTDMSPESLKILADCLKTSPGDLSKVEEPYTRARIRLPDEPPLQQRLIDSGVSPEMAQIFAEGPSGAARRMTEEELQEAVEEWWTMYKERKERWRRLPVLENLQCFILELTKRESAKPQNSNP